MCTSPELTYLGPKLLVQSKDAAFTNAQSKDALFTNVQSKDGVFTNVPNAAAYRDQGTLHLGRLCNIMQLIMSKEYE